MAVGGHFLQIILVMSILLVIVMGKDILSLKTFNFLQFLVRIVTHDIYLILCGFNECFKTIGFFKMPSVSYLDKNGRILEDLMGKNPLPSHSPCMEEPILPGHLTISSILGMFQPL